MKSSFRKLRHIATNKNSSKDTSRARHPEPAEDLETLQWDIQDVEYMREQYDGLLAAAQGIAGSAYDFSRSIQEMASYMSDTFGKIGDGQTGNIFSMLGKVQYEISKLLDLYAAHVSQTIISPTDSLMKELQSIEEMKGQFEEKRHLYNHLKSQMAKGKGGKKEKGLSPDQQVKAVKEEANDLAVLLGLRLQSLKLSQDLSLVTQGARHHAAQLHLFGKGLDSLNAVEPVVKHLSQEHKIDRTLSEVDIGNHVNVDEVDVDGEGLEVVDEEESMPSSLSSSQPLTLEKNAFALNETNDSMKELERNSKSAPISPSRYFGKSKTISTKEFQLDRPVQKAVTPYALPSPAGPIRRLNSHNAISTSRVEEDELYEVSAIGASDIHEGNEPTGHGKPSINRYRDAWQIASSEGESYFWNKSSSVNKHVNQSSDDAPAISQLVDPLYKSGPIGRSSVSRVFVSPRISPSVSPPQLSPPHISELHKLPTPPTSSNHIAGMKGQQMPKKLVPTHSQVHSQHAVVTKSRSIPSSVKFATKNLQHFKAPTSLISGSVSISPPPQNVLWPESVGQIPLSTEASPSHQI